MSEPSPRDPYDLSVVLARDETPDSLAAFVLAADGSRTPWLDIMQVLTTRFALSFDDSRLAHDRVLAGRTRAETNEPRNAPDPDHDPVAWHRISACEACR